MGLEIERKFLVADERWRAGAVGVLYRQGYINTDTERVVRVRVIGDKAILGIKALITEVTRAEYEYEIPLADGNEILEQICLQPLIDKTRYRIDVGAHTWEVDEFHGDNDGLIVAEVELASETEPFDKPAWLGAEVTGDPRYLNASLVAQPFCRW